MAVTVREVLDDTLVATAEPQVEVAGDSLDKPVRWVFTNEREDVASFLAGGELLVVEGRSLLDCIVAFLSSISARASTP